MTPSYTVNETLLSIKNVHLRYGEKVILNGVNAEVKDIERPDMTQGQVVCFLGPSGIGKSQLARCIAGLQSPTEGSIGIGAGNIPVRAGLVGLVQQSYPLFNYMTVRQNLIVAAKQGKEAEDPAGPIKLYFDRVGLSYDLLGSYPKQLSGGQRQRVAIIRQLLCSEHLLILDEPFSGLDIIAKSKACKLISDVAAMDTLNTIIVITHDVTEGMSIADTVWLMGRKPEGGAGITDTFDLADMGLAWQPDIMNNPRFQELVLHVKNRFLEAQ